MRFNKPNAQKTRTINRAGGDAYSESPKLAFAGLLLTSFLKDQFYRSAEEVYTDLLDLLEKVDPVFAAKASIFARKEFGMRTITHVVAAELAQMAKGHPWTKGYFQKVIHRPDDMLEILAYTFRKYGKYIPNAMKKGFREKLVQFDAYQLAKYKKTGAAVSMVDLVNLVHPYRTEAIDQLMKGTLKPADTWETGLTQAGQEAKTEEDKGQLKTMVWSDLLRNRKLGYFALLKNLRNIMEQAPELIPLACEQLVNEKQIKKSLVLPFRFLTAFDEIAKHRNPLGQEFLRAINEAATVSCKNVPQFEGKTLVLLDQSSSMTNLCAWHSSMTPIRVASLFAAILVTALNADLICFEGSAHYELVEPGLPVLTLARRLNHAPGGSTNFHKPFRVMNRPYDRIIVLSDMQGWDERGTPMNAVYPDYCRTFGIRPHLYSWNINDYGDLQFPEDRIYCLAGWSDKVFELMGLCEQDRKAMIHKIEAVEVQ